MFILGFFLRSFSRAAYALREALPNLPAARILYEIRVAGAVQSDAAMQLPADIFGLPAYRPHVYEASGLGAAMDAAVGIGLHADFDVAVKAMTRTSAVFEPIKAN